MHFIHVVLHHYVQFQKNLHLIQLLMISKPKPMLMIMTLIQHQSSLRKKMNILISLLSVVYQHKMATVKAIISFTSLKALTLKAIKVTIVKHMVASTFGKMASMVVESVAQTLEVSGITPLKTLLLMIQKQKILMNLKTA